MGSLMCCPVPTSTCARRTCSWPAPGRAAGRGRAGIGGAALRRGAEPGAVVQSIRSSLVASIRCIRGRDGRRDGAVRRRGRGSRGTSAHAARRAVAQRPGAGTRVLGVHGLTGRCECARCVTWGSNLPDGNPKILGGRTRNRGFFFLEYHVAFFISSQGLSSKNLKVRERERLVLVKHDTPSS